MFGKLSLARRHHLHSGDKFDGWRFMFSASTRHCPWQPLIAIINEAVDYPAERRSCVLGCSSASKQRITSRGGESRKPSSRTNTALITGGRG
jgi:hypothetical protein